MTIGLGSFMTSTHRAGVDSGWVRPWQDCSVGYRGRTVSGYDVFLADCPARTALELVSDMWTVVVLVGLAHGPRRYSYLLDRAGGISKKMLTVTLRKLVASGLVDRPQVRGGDYSLTALGESLMGPLAALTTWAEQHADDLAAVAETRAGAI
jgi:DNA-binding HxlR family transcriptional regulator